MTTMDFGHSQLDSLLFLNILFYFLEITFLLNTSRNAYSYTKNITF